MIDPENKFTPEELYAYAGEASTLFQDWDSLPEHVTTEILNITGAKDRNEALSKYLSQVKNIKNSITSKLGDNYDRD